MERATRHLSLKGLLVSAIFASVATAQLNGGAMGQVKNSIGGLDRGVRAEVGQSRPASSGGGAAPGRTSNSKWNTMPGSGSWGTRSDGRAGEGIGGWSPARKGKQSAKSRLSAGAAPGNEPMISSLGNTPGKAPAEIAKKEKGVKPILPPGGVSGAEVKPAPFGLKGFTGKAHHSYGGSREARKRSHEKLAKQLKGRGSPGLVSKRKQVEAREKPGREFQAQDDQACDDASKLRLCTWFSTR